MSLYDELVCEVPLPDMSETENVVFESKSLPDAYGARYTLTKNGRLVDSLDMDLEIDGYIEFYTAHGALRNYRAFFRDGSLVHVEAIQKPGATHWHYGIARYRMSLAPSALFK